MNARRILFAVSLMGLIGSAPIAMANNNGLKPTIFAAVATGEQPVVPSQFDIIGHIQMATLDTTGRICTPKDPKLAGGLVTVNGITITVPCNTILQMPATALTWAELFDPSLQPANVAAVAMGNYNTISGLAMTDLAFMQGASSSMSSVLQPVSDLPGISNFTPSLTAPLSANLSQPYLPTPTYQIRVQGNIMPNGQYIAGLIFISQDSLNVGQGFVKSIDYATGELCISTSRPAGSFAVQTVPSPACVAPDARVRLNDGPATDVGVPGTGRFGLSHGKPNSKAQVWEANYDPRFTVDQDNPTVHAETGYPMCIPRSFPFGPNGSNDPLCPQENRPIQVAGGGTVSLVFDDAGNLLGSRGVGCQNLPPANNRPAVNGINFPNFPSQKVGSYCHSFVMDETPNYGFCGAVTSPTTGALIQNIPCTTRPDQQAPFEVGDYVTYSGTVSVSSPLDSPATAAGSNPYYISAHTVTAALGIYTYPNTAPVYAAIESLLAGTNAKALTNIPQEATSLIKVIGFVTDPSALVDIYAMDVDQLTGVTNDRLLATVNPNTPPVIGRIKFVPAAGAFAPPTRNLRIVSRTLCNSNSTPCYYPQAGGLNPITWMPFDPAQQAANGLKYGQYNAPNFDYIFPENVGIGDQIVPNNFQDLAFLSCGSGPLNTPSAIASGSYPVVGPLNPSPWAAPMPGPVNPLNPNQALCASNLAVVAAAGPTAPIVANQPKDTVTIVNAVWDNTKGRGKLTVTAYSSLQTGSKPATPATPNNLQLYVEAFDSLGVPMSSSPLAMSIINQSPAGTAAPVCGTFVRVGVAVGVPPGGQCFQYTTTGTIVDPVAGNVDPTMYANNQFASPAISQTYIFDPYTQTNMILNGGIRVSSSRGGVGVTGDPSQPVTVRLRCNILKGFTC